MERISSVPLRIAGFGLSDAPPATASQAAQVFSDLSAFEGVARFTLAVPAAPISPMSAARDVCALLLQD